MGKKEQRDTARLEAVLELIRKQTSLTNKQEKFCDYACVERFLKAKGDNVKRAAKQLKACLSWREKIGIEHLTADEFSVELANGLAYVAGNDDESRPVMIFRMKQDYQKFNYQKSFTRLMAFTMEVAVSIMPKNVQQVVMFFDASFYRSASAFMNLLMAALKIMGVYYPGRLHKAFVIDPPSLFIYMWKGVGAFVELSGVTMVVSSESLELKEFAAQPRASSLRFTTSTAKVSSASCRFAFTVSHHVDTVKPWYLSPVVDTSVSKVGPTISPFDHARSLSRTPRPSFLQSPAMLFGRGRGRGEKCRESFLPYMKMYKRPYDEMLYKSKMPPPLDGLTSIISPHIRRRHLSLS